jgi:threonyl-tRNA synthetase
LRVETDLRNEKINYKVREHSLAKTPVLIAVGNRDVEARTVSIRRLGSDRQETLALADAVHRLKEEARAPQ